MPNNTILNRLFTLASFQKLVENMNSDVYSAIIDKYIHTTINETNADIIRYIYSYMRKQYRNQYYYKNTILNKLLLGVHSINTTTALTEIPVSTSKADFVLINGKAIVYEIKTELDNLDRLQSQIDSYYKAFDHVCVVTCDEFARVLYQELYDSKIGIYILNKNDTLKHLKEPEQCRDYLDTTIMFKILNKPEYENILSFYYGSLPITTQVMYYSKCRQYFENIPLDIAYDLFLNQLKKRNKVLDKNLFDNVPYELKSIVYFSHYRDTDYVNLGNFLENAVQGGK